VKRRSEMTGASSYPHRIYNKRTPPEKRNDCYE
jgi:hypothetical protein